MSKRSIHTVEITGGSPLELLLKGNIPLRHDGIRTVWSVYTTSLKFHELIKSIKDRHCEVKVLNPEDNPDLKLNCKFCVYRDSNPEGCCEYK